MIVGHSLDSVLAYDTLNSLINTDQTSAPNQRCDVSGRTRALVTFGSPLDKTAFMFRLQVGSEENWVREQLAASVQPLIVDYKYRPANFGWTNIWSPMDIISGALDYYDDPGMPLNNPQRVQNLIDPRAWFPISFGEHRLFGQLPDKDERIARAAAWQRVVRAHPLQIFAHVQYWNSNLLRETLYRCVT